MNVLSQCGHTLLVLAGVDAVADDWLGPASDCCLREELNELPVLFEDDASPCLRLVDSLDIDWNAEDFS